MDWLSDFFNMELGYSDIISIAEMFIRVILACVCGAFIGVERNRRQKDAGVRTHLVVALGAALFMLVSKYGFYDIVKIDGISADASRIAASVVNGVSFLGAGVIFARTTSVKGLTTSAGIWATSAVGLAFGAGMYLIGLFSTVVLIFSQIILHRYFHKLETNVSNEITVNICGDSVQLNEISEYFSKHDSQVSNIRMAREKDGKTVSRLTVRSMRSLSALEIQSLMNKFSAVSSVEIKTV